MSAARLKHGDIAAHVAARHDAWSANQSGGNVGEDARSGQCLSSNLNSGPRREAGGEGKKANTHPPYRLGMTMTSNCWGRDTACMEALSTIMSFTSKVG